MAAITISKGMEAALSKFFAEKTILDADRNSFLVCNLDDERVGIKISLVFERDWDADYYNGYSTTIVNEVGAVIVFPSYWVSIPKPLVLGYFKDILNSLYAEEFSSWDCMRKYFDSQGSDNSDCGCGCGGYTPMPGTSSFPSSTGCPVINNPYVINSVNV